MRRQLHYASERGWMLGLFMVEVEKPSNSGHSLKVKLTGLVDGLDMGEQGEKNHQDGWRCFYCDNDQLG